MKVRLITSSEIKTPLVQILLQKLNQPSLTTNNTVCSFGGPIIKNKLFFFVNGEMTRRTAPTFLMQAKTAALLIGREAKVLEIH